MLDDADLARLRGHLAVVLGDVAELGVDLDLEIERATDPDTGPGAAYLAGLGGCSLVLPGWEASSPSHELELIADRVHDWVVEELPGLHRPSDWPRCPLHPGTHPLQVRRDVDAVSWTCPRTGAALAAVGRLHELQDLERQDLDRQ